MGGGRVHGPLLRDELVRVQLTFYAEGVVLLRPTHPRRPSQHTLKPPVAVRPRVSRVPLHRRGGRGRAPRVLGRVSAREVRQIMTSKAKVAAGREVVTPPKGRAPAAGVEEGATTVRGPPIVVIAVGGATRPTL